MNHCLKAVKVTLFTVRVLVLAVSKCNIAHQWLPARAAGLRGVGVRWWGARCVLPCDWSMGLLRHVAAPGSWSMGSMDEHFYFFRTSFYAFLYKFVSENEVFHDYTM